MPDRRKTPHRGPDANPEPVPSLATPYLRPIRRATPASPDMPAAKRDVYDASGNRYALTPGGVLLTAPNSPAAASLPPLPSRALTCIERGNDGSVWIGSRDGLIRVKDWSVEFYAGKRWLPGNSVTALAALPDGIRVLTDAGVADLAFAETSLADKAARFERAAARDHTRYGFVTGCALAEPGNPAGMRKRIDDNDGLWTAMYVAAQAFRFAVSGEEEARERARSSMEAILDLERRTPIPGFPARALCHRSEEEFGNHPDGEWHRTEDGEWEWKGDTSSDEMVGHYLAWSIYFDLVADETEKAEIREVATRVTDHIIDHGYRLVDLDGKPTRWGIWDPDTLNGNPKWRAEQGLNSLEILSHLKVAHHLTGNPRYDSEYRRLAVTCGYAVNTVLQKILPGDMPGAEDNHSDDELAFLSYYPLLMYETDPSLRPIYLAGLRRSWLIERPEECPLWNVIYGACTGKPCDAEAVVRALREIPEDLVEWTVVNSRREDLELNPATDRFGNPQARVPLPWRERPLHKWNGNPYRVDGGSDRAVQCPTFWLLPYRMGRYHGIITEPAEGKAAATAAIPGCEVS